MTARWVSVAALALSVWCALPARRVAAGEDQVVQLLTAGGLPAERARSVVQRASAALADNAASGGDEYDRVRQAVGVALFGDAGPGDTLDVYRARLDQVFQMLSGGLDVPLLQALFTDDYGAAACRKDLGLSAAECRALSRAARGAGRPASTPASTRGSADELRAAGRAHYQAGRMAAALAVYERAAALDPGHAGTQAAVGACHLALGAPDQAAVAYERAVALEPNRAAFHAALGHARRAQGKAMAARFAYTRALELDPGHRGARAGLASLNPRLPARSHFPRYGTAASQAKAAPGRFPPVATLAKPSADPELLARARAAVQASIAGLTVAAPARAPAPKAAPAHDDFMEELMADPLRRQPPPEPAPAEVAATDPEGGAVDPEADAPPTDAETTAEAADDTGAADAVAEAPSTTPAAAPSPVSPVAPAGAPLPEVPSREAITAVMKAVQPLLAECAPGYRGVVEVKVVVEGPTGRVQSSDVRARGLDVGQACMRSVVEVVELPPFARPSLSIGFPYRL